MHHFGKDFVSHVVDHVFAWFLFEIFIRGRSMSFIKHVLSDFGIYEHVWVPKLMKGGGFTINSSLPTTFPNFSTFLKSFLSNILAFL